MEKTIGNYTAQSNNDFPLDCETLQYIQDNRAIAEIIGNIAGDKVILYGCGLNPAKTERSEGYVFVKTADFPTGEVLRFAGGSIRNGMFLKKTAVPVNANGNDYPQAYTQRMLEAGIGEENYSWDDFVELSGKTNRQLSEQITALQNQIKTLQPAPIGSIVIWPTDEIPQNYTICNGETLPKDEYQELYKVIGDKYKNSNDNPSASNRFRLPNLQNRFVAGKGTYEGYTQFNVERGANKVLLTASESGLPSHKHSITYKTYRGSNESGANRFRREGSNEKEYTISTDYAGGQSAKEAHENRPPFIVMNYIIKIK